jgi:hypothetical protein
VVPQPRASKQQGHWPRWPNAKTHEDKQGSTHVVILQNHSAIPDIPSGDHLLEFEDVELTQRPSFEDPSKIEDKLRVHLRIRTPGVDDDSFHVLMSPKFGETATLGGIIRAIFGSAPPNGDFDTNLLIGQRFRCMVGHSATGWPRLINGTAAPADEPPL